MNANETSASCKNIYDVYFAFSVTWGVSNDHAPTTLLAVADFCTLLCKQFALCITSKDI